MIGSTVSHYKILGTLGSGGMGVVYEAEDIKLGRRVALKFLPDADADAASRERFEREARASSSLNHENICTVYESGEHDGRPYIAMELLEGQPLDRLLAAGALPLDQLLDFAIQIADALDAAHQRHLVHRDIKPGNIFVTARNRVKVLDFGLAKLSQASTMETAGGATLASQLTSPGSAVGTIAYMSPEQARGEELDARSDLFSFGTVLYQMATGVLPFEGKTSAVVFHAILEKTQVSPMERNAAIPEKLDEIINKALEKDPEMRYQTAAEMRGDLKRLRRDSSSGKTHAAASSASHISTAAPPSSVTVPAATSSRMKVVFFGAIALLLIAVIVAAYAFYSQRPSIRTQDLVFTPITENGQVVSSAVSPDGKLLAYVLRGTQRSLHVKQIATGSDVEIVPPQNGFYGAISFTPDGSYLYYAHTVADSPLDAIFVVPSLGGTSRRVVDEVAEGISVSPDGKLLAFSRIDPTSTQARMWVSNLDGSNAHIIGGEGLPHTYQLQNPPSWSSDSKFIATVIQLYEGHLGGVVVLPVAGGSPKLIPLDVAPQEAAWMPDGSGFLMSAVSRSTHLKSQIYFQPYPSGKLIRVSNDLNDYHGISITADSKAMVTSQYSLSGDLYAGALSTTDDLKSLNTHKIFQSMALIDDSRLVAQDNALNFWTVNTDGSGLNSFLNSETLKQAPVPCPDGKSLLYVTIDEQNNAKIARADYTSSAGTPLTKGPYDFGAVCLADQKSFLYLSEHPNTAADLMKTSFDGGPATKIMSGDFGDLGLSPDRTVLLMTELRHDKDKTIRHAITISLTDFHIVNDVAVPPRATGFGVLADNSGVTFQQRDGNVDNLYGQSFSGGAAHPLTNYKSGHIRTYEITRDGKTVLISRGDETVNAVMLSNFR